MNILASSPDIGLSGANVLLAQLLRGMASSGNSVKWLVTSHEGGADAAWLDGMGLEFNALPPTPVRAVRRRQEMIVNEVTKASPCCYFPNYDFDMLWAAQAFCPKSRTVFIMHCDDPVYYDAINQRGDVMDAIVCVSEYLTHEVRRRRPELASRVYHIPFGVELPSQPKVKSSLQEGPLEVIYCGRLSEEQKRIGDVAQIINDCYRNALPTRFHIAGSGPDEDQFFASLKEPMADGFVIRYGKLPHADISALLERCHVFLLTSAYEGLPVSLLEAMAHGVVPVVSAVKSGIPEIVEHAENGFTLPIGDIDSFCNHLKLLANSSSILQKCSNNAKNSIEHSAYTFSSSLDAYLKLCAELLDKDESPPIVKSPKIQLPPKYKWLYKLKMLLNSPSPKKWP
jgi:glycosyltransferase involved in cell wall biosynthesis